MAERLTDKKRKQIIADYIECQNYSAVARKHGISDRGVKKIVMSDSKLAVKLEDKKSENTQSTLAYMSEQHETKKRIAEKLLKAIEQKAETVDMFDNVRDFATAYGIIIDKEFKFAEIGQSLVETFNPYAGLPARVLGAEWVDVNRAIDERAYSQYDFKGGRGSLKSSFCGLKMIDLIMLNEKFCGLAVRQLKDNLKDSVYAQIVWAIDELGLTEHFHCTKSPMEIKRKSTGQIIFFRGADDPGKIKSIKPPKDMHIGVVWIEESDQLHGENARRNILQSAFRGGDEGILFESYNTPISQKHYKNIEARKVNPRRFVHHSHFKNAPRRWLGDIFYEIAAALEISNPRAYKHEYDGEATGTGATIFENISVEAISDKQIKDFDRVLWGVDWGFYPDPFAAVACYLHKGSMTLYIYDELYEYKKGNKETAELMKAKKATAPICDSAEPKSVKDYKDYGLSAKGAVKGPGSVEYSHKWLQSMNKIIIDPERCPNTANEFLSYEYLRSKDGEIISGYPDSNNHLIDATRYATNDIWRKREDSGYIKVS